MDAISRVRYEGGRGDAIFSIPFFFFENSHIRVVIVDGGGGERVLSPGVDFVVNRLSDSCGDVVLLGDAPAAGEALIISRLVPLTQEYSFSGGDADLPGAVEAALDRITMMVQQLRADMAGSVPSPPFVWEHVMDNHYFDADGVYLRSAPANPGSMTPADALRVAPPESPGHWPVLNRRRDGWKLVQDHRGRRGWLNGEAAEITRLGPLPEGWSELPPEEPVPGEPESATPADGEVEAEESSVMAPEPTPTPDEAAVESVPAAPVQRYYLTASGTCHREGCRYLGSKGEWLTVRELLARKRAPKLCGLCRPAVPEDGHVD